MIKTKSIYEPKSKDDGLRVLITRYYPRGVKKEHFDEWKRELAPSRELLKSYKIGEITWKQFEREFLKQMNGQDSTKMIQRLSHIAKNNSVTLLCYEKKENNCHRHLIHDLVLNQI
ncbi:MAG: DUF488 family protein [Thaumarchaeota archaeon]|nr:DUF488 family protein [Nitrososphaerota archaeon]